MWCEHLGPNHCTELPHVSLRAQVKMARRVQGSGFESFYDSMVGVLLTQSYVFNSPPGQRPCTKA